MADSKNYEWESAPTKSVMEGWESAPSSVSVPSKTPDEIRPTPEKEKLSPTSLVYFLQRIKNIPVITGFCCVFFAPNRC